MSSDEEERHDFYEGQSSVEPETAKDQLTPTDFKETPDTATTSPQLSVEVRKSQRVKNKKQSKEAKEAEAKSEEKKGKDKTRDDKIQSSQKARDNIISEQRKLQTPVARVSHRKRSSQHLDVHCPTPSKRQNIVHHDDEEAGPSRIEEKDFIDQPEQPKIPITAHEHFYKQKKRKYEDIPDPNPSNNQQTPGAQASHQKRSSHHLAKAILKPPKRQKEIHYDDEEAGPSRLQDQGLNEQPEQADMPVVADERVPRKRKYEDTSDPNSSSNPPEKSCKVSNTDRDRESRRATSNSSTPIIPSSVTRGEETSLLSAIEPLSAPITHAAQYTESTESTDSTESLQQRINEMEELLMQREVARSDTLYNTVPTELPTMQQITDARDTADRNLHSDYESRIADALTQTRHREPPNTVRLGYNNDNQYQELYNFQEHNIAQSSLVEPQSGDYSRTQISGDEFTQVDESFDQIRPEWSEYHHMQQGQHQYPQQSQQYHQQPNSELRIPYQTQLPWPHQYDPPHNQPSQTQLYGQYQAQSPQFQQQEQQQQPSMEFQQGYNQDQQGHHQFQQNPWNNKQDDFLQSHQPQAEYPWMQQPYWDPLQQGNTRITQHAKYSGRLSSDDSSLDQYLKSGQFMNDKVQFPSLSPPLYPISYGHDVVSRGEIPGTSGLQNPISQKSEERKHSNINAKLKCNCSNNNDNNNCIYKDFEFRRKRDYNNHKAAMKESTTRKERCEEMIEMNAEKGLIQKMRCPYGARNKVDLDKHLISSHLVCTHKQCCNKASYKNKYELAKHLLSTRPRGNEAGDIKNEAVTNRHKEEKKGDKIDPMSKLNEKDKKYLENCHLFKCKYDGCTNFGVQKKNITTHEITCRFGITARNARLAEKQLNSNQGDKVEEEKAALTSSGYTCEYKVFKGGKWIECGKRYSGAGSLYKHYRSAHKVEYFLRFCVCYLCYPLKPETIATKKFCEEIRIKEEKNIRCLFCDKTVIDNVHKLHVPTPFNTVKKYDSEFLRQHLIKDHQTVGDKTFLENQHKEKVMEIIAGQYSKTSNWEINTVEITNTTEKCKRPYNVQYDNFTKDPSKVTKFCRWLHGSETRVYCTK